MIYGRISKIFRKGETPEHASTLAGPEDQFAYMRSCNENEYIVKLEGAKLITEKELFLKDLKLAGISEFIDD